MMRPSLGWALPAYAVLLYAFLYLPIGVIVLFAFDAKAIPGLPLSEFTTAWFTARRWAAWTCSPSRGTA